MFRLDYETIFFLILFIQQYKHQTIYLYTFRKYLVCQIFFYYYLSFAVKVGIIESAPTNDPKTFTAMYGYSVLQSKGHNPAEA